MIQDSAPNSYSVWIQVVTGVTTVASIIVSHWLANKKVKEIKDINTEQSKQLGAVHTLVNGDRLARTIRIAQLEAKLKANGLEP